MSETSYFNFVIEYGNKTEIMQMESDSEFFQLKMLISAKFKIYDISKCFIYFQSVLLNEVDDKTFLNNVFDQGDEIPLKILNEKLEVPEMNNDELKNSNNQTILKEKEYKVVYVCSCNNKNEASNICVKCFEFICDQCKQRDPHLMHRDEVLKKKNFPEYMQQYMEKAAAKLDDGVLSDEAFIFLNNFQETLKSDIENVNKTFMYLQRILEEIKGLQVNYLLQLDEKLCFSDRYNDINLQINLLLEDFKTVNLNEENDLEVLLAIRKKIGMESENLQAKYSALSKHLNVYLTSYRELQTLNKQISSQIKEKFIYSQTSFNISTLNNRLAALTKSKIFHLIITYFI